MNIPFFTQLACLWEATARKAGNVHRFQDFQDLHYLDFLHSAVALGNVFAPGQPVGTMVLTAVEATRTVVRTNTNLGMILLLAPLAAAPAQRELGAGVEEVLRNLTLADARDVFAAIRLAQPGGLGEAPDQDVHNEPTLPLRDIMALAQDRDLIARQYANGFQEIFDWGLPRIRRELEAHGALEPAIVRTHLHFLAEFPDSLIVRKRGLPEAEEVQRRARVVLKAEGPERQKLFADLDRWLRIPGQGRNPGTSADLVAACLFAALRNGIISLPLDIPWSSEPHHG